MYISLIIDHHIKGCMNAEKYTKMISQQIIIFCKESYNIRLTSLNFDYNFSHFFHEFRQLFNVPVF